MTNNKEKFFQSIKKTDGCWVFTGPKHKCGYGYIRFSGKKMLAHRIMWLLVNGEIPSKLLVCHKCDNPPCVNPNHLFLGTHDDNMKDMVSKGRSKTGFRVRPVIGQNSPFSKLTDIMVKNMRADRIRHKLKITEIARRNGVSIMTASRAIRGVTWKHVK